MSQSEHKNVNMAYLSLSFVLDKIHPKKFEVGHKLLIHIVACEGHPKQNP